MGVNNRQRRKAKQQAFRQRERTRTHRDQVASDYFESVQDAADSALRAKETGDASQLRVNVAWLADPRGRLLVDVMFAEMIEGGIASAWEIGWQPVDLARVARRQCDARAERMAADLITSELRRYAAATIDEEWDRQVHALGALIQPSGDEAYFDEFGARHGVDRLAAVQTGVDLLFLLSTLPELPKLCERPGRARRGSLRGHRRDDRLLERVRALLAKAESTNFPDEAEAYTAKAQELMARHSIDYAVLSAKQGSQEKPGGRRIGVDNPYEEPKALLLDITARAGRCRAIWSRQLGFSTVLGFPSDVDATEMLFTSLLLQATAAMRHVGRAKDGRTTSFRRSFLTGYAHRIGDRLADANKSAGQSAQAEHAGRHLPVLARRDAAVEELFAELFPEMTRRASNVNHREGWIAGQRAADRARLQQEQLSLSQR